MARRYYLRLLFRVILFALLSAAWWYNTYQEFPGIWSEVAKQAVQFFLFVVGLNLALSLLLLIYRRRKGLALTARNNLTSGAENIYGVIVTFAFFGLLLSLWGIEFKTLFTSLSIVAAAIAIVSKEFVSPIIGGFIIAISKELSIGDFVKVNEHKGRIIDLTLTKIELLNEDEDIIYIPNDKAYLGEIINYSKGDVRRVSISFELASGFDGTVEDLETNLTKALDTYHKSINQKSFNLRIVEIRKDAISFKFQYTLDRTDRELEKEIKKKTIRRVLNFVKERAVHVTET